MFVCFFVLLQWISRTLCSGLIRCVAFDPRAVVLLLYRRMTYEALGAIFFCPDTLKYGGDLKAFAGESPVAPVYFDP